MSEPIEYFYSTHSAFAYLGSSLFRQIAAESGRPVRYVPFDLRAALATHGHQTTGSLTAARHAYFFGREIQRWSEYREAPVMGERPTWHDNSLSLSSTVVIAADKLGLDAGELTHAMLREHWQNDADLADENAVRHIIELAAMDSAQLLAKAADPDVLAIYEQNTAEAIERQVFGSPTYFVDGDMFYGQDRLELVARALKKPFA